MIFDVTVIIALGHHKPCPCKIVNLSAVNSDCCTELTAASLTLPLLRPPYSLGYDNIKIRPILKLITLQWLLSVQMKSPVYPTLNQEMYLIKLSEEGMPKAEMGRKLALLANFVPVSQLWKVVAEPGKTPWFLASRGEEFNLGPEIRLDCSELLGNKVLLKYKREKASDTDIRRGQKECPLR